ncbi:MAG: hypothetical protein ACI8Y4_003843 [Candidatus Poriferisodalaceae bacterium]|jgi:hypothetical protein
MEGNADLDDQLLLIVRDPTYDVTQGIPPAAPEHGSIRRLTRDEHDIEIHTHYKIVIDGEEFPDPFHVMNNGSVSYHGLPQYSTTSAVDLVKRIVDELIDEEPPPIGGQGKPGSPLHGDHHNPAGGH